MSEEQELEYWKMKYTLLEEQYGQLKERNQQLEDRILEIVEKTETDKMTLSREIDSLTRKVEKLETGAQASSSTETEEPEDPVVLDRSSPIRLEEAPKTKVMEYHHLPVLACEEGLIYGFRWDKGSVVKVV